MKKIIFFVLTPVLALSLCFSLAFAAPALPADAGTVESMDANAPQYLVYMAPYTINLQNNTYADITFFMAERGGATYFEGLSSISFHTTNPGGSHWKVVEYSHTISDERFYLYLTLQDMEGDTPSSYYMFDTAYTVLPSMVTGRSLAAEDVGGVILAPDSVRVRYVGETQDALPASNGDGAMLAPDSVRVRYVGETQDALPASNGDGVMLAPDSVRVRYVGETQDALPASNGDGAMLAPDSVRVRYVGETQDTGSQNADY